MPILAWTDDIVKDVLADVGVDGVAGFGEAHLLEAQTADDNATPGHDEIPDPAPNRKIRKVRM